MAKKNVESESKERGKTRKGETHGDREKSERKWRVERSIERVRAESALNPGRPFSG